MHPGHEREHSAGDRRCVAEKVPLERGECCRGADWIWVMADVVKPDIVLSDCEDPDDNRILEAAVAGGVECVVSGDRHLLRMKVFRGVEIVNVDEFIDRIEIAAVKRVKR
jgi:hypothetical protein